MAVVRAADRSTRQGAAANFTGTVWQDEVVVGAAPSRMRATVVSFTPGARTAWHAHPVGQVLYCLSGVGRICIGKGSRPQAIFPGDTVMIPPPPGTTSSVRNRLPADRQVHCLALQFVSIINSLQ